MIHCLLYKHWIVYLRLAIFFLFMVGLPAVGYFFLEAQGTQTFDLTENAHRWITIIFLLYIDLMLLVGFIRWLEEDMDIILVTNERIISIEQLSFFNRTVSETELSQVQDVKHVARGMLSNLLNFGNLEVQTAAEKILFVMKDVGQGEHYASQILTLCREYKRGMNSPHGHGPGAGA